VRSANTSTGRDPACLFSPPLSRTGDIPVLIRDLELKAAVHHQQQEPPAAALPCSSRKWYYVSDTNVSEVSEEKVLKAQAYLLFYERIL
jgi:hypothetical protein